VKSLKNPQNKEPIAIYSPKQTKLLVTSLSNEKQKLMLSFLFLAKLILEHIHVDFLFNYITVFPAIPVWAVNAGFTFNLVKTTNLTFRATAKNAAYHSLTWFQNHTT